ncbi:MAG: sensor histidine kinase, partial [Caldilineae bacterium]
PILTQGVYWTVREVVSQFKRDTELTVHLDMDRASLESLPVSVSTVAYQVLHESLVNVQKHAHAAQVWIHVARDAGMLYLRVEDDGCGIPDE